MARFNIVGDLKQTLANGDQVVAAHGAASTGDRVTAVTTAIDDAIALGVLAAADIAAAQLIGAGDASAEIDALDISVAAYVASVTAANTLAAATPNSAAVAALIDAAFDLTPALTAAVAAAQLIGAGDASAEVDAIETAFDLVVAALALAKDASDIASASVSSTADFEISFDTSVVTTLNQYRALARAAEQAVVSSGRLS